MRKITFYFLYFEILDIITTFVGLSVGLWETNPLAISIGWKNLILCKFLAVLFIAIILQIKKSSWLDILVLLIAIVAPIWNSFNLLFVVLYYLT